MHFAFKASIESVMSVVCTVAYRFFPLMMLFCVVLVSVLGRDFGPMLTAEKISTISNLSRQEEAEQPTEMKTRSINESKSSEDAYTGKLVNIFITFTQAT